MTHPADKEIDKIIEKHIGHDPFLVRYRELVDKKHLNHVLTLEEFREFKVLSEIIDLEDKQFYRPIIQRLKEAS
jgi:hypothetical protein